MPGTLFVVATPIGNLEDITLRALRVLREVDLIAAEDTRRTARLLAHHGIQTSTLSFHEHNVQLRLPGLLRRLVDEDAHVAVVSDAGTPGISDPGTRLVRACRERDVPVVAVPGASAPLTAAVTAGFPLVPLSIYGFAPHRASDRKRWFAALAGIEHTFTFFETPHRIRQTLQDLAELMGDRPIAVARELTKVFEEVRVASARTLADEPVETKGEFTIVIGPQDVTAKPKVLASDQMIAEEFGRLTTAGAMARREALTAVARKFGLPSRAVYAALERTKVAER